LVPLFQKAGEGNGWVTVHQNDNTFTVKSYNKVSTVKVTCTRTIDQPLMK
jgi:hypothetical protein